MQTSFEIQGDILDLVSSYIGTMSCMPISTHTKSRREDSFQWAKTRTICKSFCQSIDNAAKAIMTSEESSLHFTKNCCRYLERAKPSFLAFAFMRARVCVLCKNHFTGCVSKLGIYAHPVCIKTHTLATSYLSRPLNSRAIERMNEIDKHLEPVLQYHDYLTEDYALTNLPTLFVVGFNRNQGYYSYELALVGPDVPMLPRSATVLGNATSNNDELQDCMVKYNAQKIIDEIVDQVEYNFQRKKRKKKKSKRKHED